MNLDKLREFQANLIEDKIHHNRLIAKDAMVDAVVFNENEEIENIVNKLKQETINHVIITNDDDEFIGEISVENLIKIIAHTSINEPLVKILDVGYHRGINYTIAKDHLENNPIIVTYDTLILDVLKLIDEKGFNYIPVLDEKNKICGIITPSSLLDLLSKN